MFDDTTAGGGIEWVQGDRTEEVRVYKWEGFGGRGGLSRGIE